MECLVLSDLTNDLMTIAWRVSLAKRSMIDGREPYPGSEVEFHALMLTLFV